MAAGELLLRALHDIRNVVELLIGPRCSLLVGAVSSYPVRLSHAHRVEPDGSARTATVADKRGSRAKKVRPVKAARAVVSRRLGEMRCAVT